MSTKLNGNKYSPEGSAFQQIFCPTAIRYEAARAVIFEEWGNFVRANDCLRLKRYYERRAMEEFHLMLKRTMSEAQPPNPLTSSQSEWKQTMEKFFRFMQRIQEAQTRIKMGLYQVMVQTINIQHKALNSLRLIYSCVTLSNPGPT